MSVRITAEAQLKGLRKASETARERTRKTILSACLALEDAGIEPTIMGVWDQMAGKVSLSAVSSRKRHNDIVRARSRAFRIARGLAVDDDAPDTAATQSSDRKIPDDPQALRAALRAAWSETEKLGERCRELRVQVDELAAAIAGERAEAKMARKRAADAEADAARLRGEIHARLPVMRRELFGKPSLNGT